MKKKKLLAKVMAAPENVHFSELQTLVEAFGFQLARVHGSHHIYLHPEIGEMINLQNRKGRAKPYQIRQFLTLVEEHNLDLDNDS